MDEEECVRLLGTRHLGRVGVSMSSLPAIFPVNFRVDGDRILFRTGQGTKLAAALDEAVVAFEVDSFDSFGHDGWSVLVVGRARLVAADEGIDPTLIRPWAGGHRPHLVAIRIERVSGRRIRHDLAAEPLGGAEE